MNNFEISKIEVESKEIKKSIVDIKEKLEDWDLDKPILEQMEIFEKNIDDLDISSEVEATERTFEDWDLDKPILEQMEAYEKIIEETDEDKVLENKEIPKDNVDEDQKKAIEKFEEGDKDEYTNLEKGNYGEIKTDQELKERGYERISIETVENLDDVGGRGIDGVYHNPDGDPEYLIVESKYGSSKLGETADGRQMSENWIDNRLDEAVGKEKADDIRMSDYDEVGSYISHIDSDGNITYDKLDAQGNVVEKDVEINA